MLKIKSVYEKICLKNIQAFIGKLRLTGVTKIYDENLIEYSKLRESYELKNQEMADSIDFMRQKQYF